MIVVFGIVLFEVLQKNRRPALQMALAVVPYFVWRGFVTWRLFKAFGWYGFFYEPQNLSLPFSGIVHVYSAVAFGTYLAEIGARGILFHILLNMIVVIFGVYLLYK